MATMCVKWTEKKPQHKKEEEMFKLSFYAYIYFNCLLLLQSLYFVSVPAAAGLFLSLCTSMLRCLVCGHKVSVCYRDSTCICLLSRLL